MVQGVAVVVDLTAAACQGGAQRSCSGGFEVEGIAGQGDSVDIDHLIAETEGASRRDAEGAQHPAFGHHRGSFFNSVLVEGYAAELEARVLLASVAVNAHFGETGHCQAGR